MATERYTCEDMIRAAKETHGMVYESADLLGCSHTTVYNYMDRHPTVAEAFEHERGLMLDKAERRLRDALEKGESWAIQFALKFLGEDRGYASKSKQEITGEDGGPIRQQITEIVVEHPNAESVED